MTELEVGTRLTIGDHEVDVAPHPGAPDLPYAQEGRIATVYQVRDKAMGQRYALKVYRDASTFQRVIANGDLLHSIERPGLSAAAFERVQGPATKQWPSLKSAILMPWVEGSTWQDIIVDGQELSAAFLLAAAQQLAETLAWLESRGMTHGDVCGANLLLLETGPSTGSAAIELVDLDQVSDADSQSTMTIAAGSPGYVPEDLDFDEYRRFADRCAGGILIAEILAWAYPEARSTSDAETFFAPSEILKPSHRLEVMQTGLGNWGPIPGSLLRRLWNSAEPSAWPSLREWHTALQGLTAPDISTGTTRRKAQPMPAANRPGQDGDWEKQMLSSWQAKTLGETRTQGLGNRALAFAGVGTAIAGSVLMSGLIGFDPVAVLGQPATFATSAALLAVVAAALNVWFYRRALGASEIWAVAARAVGLAGLAGFSGGLFLLQGQLLAGGLVGVLAGSAVAASIVQPSAHRREYTFATTVLTWIGAWVAAAIVGLQFGAGGGASVVEVLVVLGGIGGMTAVLVGLTPDVEF